MHVIICFKSLSLTKLTFMRAEVLPVLLTMYAGDLA